MRSPLAFWQQSIAELRRVFHEALGPGAPMANPPEFARTVTGEYGPPAYSVASRLAVGAAKSVKGLRALGKGAERRVRAVRRRLFPRDRDLWRPPITLPRHRATDLLTRAQAEELLATLPERSLISLVVQGGADSPAARSALSQYYREWELIVLDPAQNETAPALSLAHDPRVTTIPAGGLGEVAALNAGLAAARGPYVAFLQTGHELTADALTWIAWAIGRHPDSAWLYSDHDYVSPADAKHGERRNVCPCYKPDFSPEFLLANAFTDPVSVYRTDAIRKLAGFEGETPEAARHDLALRLSEQIDATQVVHLPVILCHCHERKVAAPTPESRAASEQVVAQALRRRQVQGVVWQQAFHPGCFAIDLRPSRFPTVDILLPTRNAFELVRDCIASVRAHTGYPHYRIVVIDNQSDCPRLAAYLEEETAQGGLVVFPYDQPFNHSDMHNQAIRALESELVVFLNNDIEITSPAWLEQLVASLEFDPRIAGVGALLTFPDGTVQHGGLLLGTSGVVSHAHRLAPATTPGYFGRLHSLQELSGVTAALAILRRDAFLAVGGFCAERYPTSFNDVDLWLRLRQAGYRCLYNPQVQAIHFESKTRGRDPRELLYSRRLQEDWLDALRNDPFYNPNLTLHSVLFDGFRAVDPADLSLRARQRAAQPVADAAPVGSRSGNAA